MKKPNLSKLEYWLKLKDQMRGMSVKDLNILIQMATEQKRNLGKMSSFKYSLGDQVMFGRPNGRQRLGKIVKLNAAKALIEEVGGSKWRVPYSLIKAA
mgnify:CR=1 FL=1